MAKKSSPSFIADNRMRVMIFIVKETHGWLKRRTKNDVTGLFLKSR